MDAKRKRKTNDKWRCRVDANGIRLHYGENIVDGVSVTVSRRMAKNLIVRVKQG